MKKKKSFASQCASDKAFILGGNIFLGIFVLAIILPIVYIIVASFIDPVTLQNNGITLDFSKWTTTAYQRVISNKQIWVGFGNAILYAVVFTAVSVLITLLAAYPMSRSDFRGKKLFNVLFVITMFFGGGLIPTYLVISDLGLLNSMWAIILPGAFSVWNMIIARTYYQNIPAELREAAEMDGANEVVYFFRILLPVCKPVIAVLVLWQFVGMWNSYFDAMVYLSDEAKQPLQLVLRAILIQNQPQSGRAQRPEHSLENY